MVRDGGGQAVRLDERLPLRNCKGMAACWLRCNITNIHGLIALHRVHTNGACWQDRGAAGCREAWTSSSQLAGTHPPLVVQSQPVRLLPDSREPTPRGNATGAHHTTRGMPTIDGRRPKVLRRGGRPGGGDSRGGGVRHIHPCTGQLGLQVSHCMHSRRVHGTCDVVGGQA